VSNPQQFLVVGRPRLTDNDIIIDVSFLEGEVARSINACGDHERDIVLKYDTNFLLKLIDSMVDMDVDSFDSIKNERIPRVSKCFPNSMQLRREILRDFTIPNGSYEYEICTPDCRLFSVIEVDEETKPISVTRLNTFDGLQSLVQKSIQNDIDTNIHERTLNPPRLFRWEI
jgi:hypothetical protein